MRLLALAALLATAVLLLRRRPAPEEQVVMDDEDDDGVVGMPTMFIGGWWPESDDYAIRRGLFGPYLESRN